MELVELIVLMAAVSGSVWIVGIGGWLWHRIKRLEDAALGQGGPPKELLAELEQLKEVLSAGDHERELLNERLDFLERLLNPGEIREPDERQRPRRLEAEREGTRRGTD
jgi:hypothetical protein